MVMSRSRVHRKGCRPRARGKGRRRPSGFPGISQAVAHWPSNRVPPPGDKGQAKPDAPGCPCAASCASLFVAFASFAAHPVVARDIQNNRRCLVAQVDIGVNLFRYQPSARVNKGDAIRG